MCSSFRAALCLPLGHIVKRCGQSHCVSVRRCSGQYQLLLYSPTYMRRPLLQTAPRRKEVLSAWYYRLRRAVWNQPQFHQLQNTMKKRPQNGYLNYFLLLCKEIIKSVHFTPKSFLICFQSVYCPQIIPRHILRNSSDNILIVL